MIACERKGTRPTRPARSIFLCVQNLKPHDDESEDTAIIANLMLLLRNWTVIDVI